MNNIQRWANRVLIPTLALLLYAGLPAYGEESLSDTCAKDPDCSRALEESKQDTLEKFGLGKKEESHNQEELKRESMREYAEEKCGGYVCDDAPKPDQPEAPVREISPEFLKNTLSQDDDLLMAKLQDDCSQSWQVNGTNLYICRGHLKNLNRLEADHEYAMGKAAFREQWPNGYLIRSSGMAAQLGFKRGADGKWDEQFQPAATPEENNKTAGNTTKSTDQASNAPAPSSPTGVGQTGSFEEMCGAELRNMQSEWNKLGQNGPAVGAYYDSVSAMDTTAVQNRINSNAGFVPGVLARRSDTAAYQATNVWEDCLLKTRIAQLGAAPPNAAGNTPKSPSPASNALYTQCDAQAAAMMAVDDRLNDVNATLQGQLAVDEAAKLKGRIDLHSKIKPVDTAQALMNHYMVCVYEARLQELEGVADNSGSDASGNQAKSSPILRRGGDAGANAALQDSIQQAEQWEKDRPAREAKAEADRIAAAQAQERWRQEQQAAELARQQQQNTAPAATYTPQQDNSSGWLDVLVGVAAGVAAGTAQGAQGQQQTPAAGMSGPCTGSAAACEEFKRGWCENGSTPTPGQGCYGNGGGASGSSSSDSDNTFSRSEMR